LVPVIDEIKGQLIAEFMNLRLNLLAGRKGMKDYVHRELEEEVMAIGGHYTFTDEVRLPFGENEVLYLKGYALFDSTCCGASGCGYALVQGFVAYWKMRKDGDGYFVSRVKPIKDPDTRRQISRLIKEKELVQQVRFV
jgi:hypothetical protein